MTQSTTMAIRLNPDIERRLDRLAESIHRSRSFLAADAIKEYVSLNEWQIQEIEQALQESDQADFASDSEVKQFFKQWQVDAG